MNLDIKNKIKDLVEKINFWNQEYFDNENSVVSDRVYDSHLKQLIELEKQYPEYVLQNSPTKNIGASVKTKFKKVEHSKQMLSLDKAYNFDEIRKFINDTFKVTNDPNMHFYIEPKIDGLSISLKYENGNLVQASTRGNGLIGEDVTQNVYNIIQDIPTQIKYQQSLEVRGEIYISKHNFDLINKIEDQKYANPRNLASGTLRQLDSSIVKRRNLSAFIYEVIDPNKHNLNSQKEIIDFLNFNNFKVTSNTFLVSINEQDKMFEFIENFSKIKDDIDFEIDGLVIKLNEIKYYNQIGFTSKFPKYAIAYKFDDEIIKTTLDDIFVTIGRTGIVTYNAKLKTVLLKNTMVSAATLHNYNYIQDLNLGINDEVYIKKAGEIIPKVISVAHKHSSDVFKKILICPYCQHDLIDTKTLNNQICVNQNCPEINIKKIIHFASKDAMDIEGLGEGIVRKFFELGFLTKIEDIYTLDQYKEQIINEKGFGPKFWQNLETSIKKSKSVSLVNLLFALGISQVGLRNAKTIAMFIESFVNFEMIDLQSLENTKDIGPITIEEIKEFLSKEINLNLIHFLISIGINPSFSQNQQLINSYFSNKKIVITGTFKMSRDDIKRLLETHGAQVLSSISKNVDIVLVGEKAGSKLTKAQEMNIQIINEEEFENILIDYQTNQNK